MAARRAPGRTPGATAGIQKSFAAPTSATPTGYVVIMINFHGSTGYGQKFIDAINGDWGGAPYEDLMKGFDYAEETLRFY